MWKNIFRTSNDSVATLLRITLGLVILPHGAQKLFGWFGGGGVDGTLAFFQSLGVPAALGALAIFAESAGAVALIVGLGGRIAALLIGGVMVGAIYLVHLPYGFFMDWAGTQGGHGFEYHLLTLAIAAAVVVKGSGALSVDRLLVPGDDREDSSSSRETSRKAPIAA